MPETLFPVLARIDPNREATIANADLAALANEVTLLLHQAVDGPERRGLLKLRALALAGHGRPGADLWVIGDWYRAAGTSAATPQPPITVTRGRRKWRPGQHVTQMFRIAGPCVDSVQQPSEIVHGTILREARRRHNPD